MAGKTHKESFYLSKQIRIPVVTEGGKKTEMREVRMEYVVTESPQRIYNNLTAKPKPQVESIGNKDYEVTFEVDEEGWVKGPPKIKQHKQSKLPS